MISVFIWSVSLYLASIFLGSIIVEALPIPKSMAVALPLLAIALITFAYPWVKKLRRKA
jgi:membrane protein DedA with SNARE-associated domain